MFGAQLYMAQGHGQIGVEIFRELRSVVLEENAEDKMDRESK